MRWFLLGVLILAFPVGCGDNECSVDSDCADGGVCAEGGGVVFASRVCVYGQSDLGEPERDLGFDAGTDDMDVDQAEECVRRLNHEICLSISAECGTPEVEECGETIELSCGQCTRPLTCSDSFQCECVAETDDEFCTRYGAACGSLTNTDNCDDTRSVDCGPCSGEEVCGERAPNVCGCPCEIEQECFSDGQNPDNPCEVCDPAQSTSAWTSQPGRSCDDGDKCTENDVCGADGTCAGDPVECTTSQCRTASCDPDTGACVEENSSDGSACLGSGSLSCVFYACFSGACRERIQPDSCLINDTCYDEGDRNPSNECEWCEGSSPSSWVAATGQSCTDDGLACTDDVCDDSASCTHPIRPNRCLINNTCYSDGESPNFNCCRGCDSSVSQTTDSPINVGMPCSLGCECSPTGSCVSGSDLCIPNQCI